LTAGWFRETLHPGQDQGFEIGETLYSETTDFQELAIYETPALGRVLVLDGVVQTTEADEFYYHEMIVHPAVLAHGAVRRVLIIGGGDGGALRETLRHPTIERVTLVEIDPKVVALARDYLPSISAGAFDDTRTEIVFADGIRFAAESKERWDLIVVDSTDPIGPAVALFEDPFYRDCRRLLGDRGILVRQAGVPFFQRDEFVTTHRRLAACFTDASFNLVPVPTYCGGAMALAWASDEPAYRTQTLEVIRDRFAESGLTLRYYTPEVHVAAFALPAFMMEMIAGTDEPHRGQHRRRQ
jgi:spermidine synthase